MDAAVAADVYEVSDNATQKIREIHISGETIL
jgi:hypothetical protein